MESFKTDIPVMQQHIVRWIQSSVMRNFQLGVDEVSYWLRRVLFIDLNPNKNLSDYDVWPCEPDKTHLVNAVTSCNLQQGTELYRARAIRDNQLRGNNVQKGSLYKVSGA